MRPTLFRLTVPYYGRPAVLYCKGRTTKTVRSKFLQDIEYQLVVNGAGEQVHSGPASPGRFSGTSFTPREGSSA